MANVLKAAFLGVFAAGHGCVDGAAAEGEQQGAPPPPPVGGSAALAALRERAFHKKSVPRGCLRAALPPRRKKYQKKKKKKDRKKQNTHQLRSVYGSEKSRRGAKWHHLSCHCGRQRYISFDRSAVLPRPALSGTCQGREPLHSCRGRVLISRSPSPDRDSA